MYQPLIKFHPHPAIITQVLCIFVSPIRINNTKNNDNEQIENVYNSHSSRDPILPFGS